MNSKYIDEPANDVLKRLLHLTEDQVKKNVVTAENGGLTVKVVFLKSGMKLRKSVKGKTYEALVKNGYIEFQNKKYTSPSGAAVDAVNGSVNGWRFWNYFDENDGKWKLLDTLRK